MNVGTTVPYRYSIGLAISEDNGRSFRRSFPGPVIEISHDEPRLCTAPCVVAGWVWANVDSFRDRNCTFAVHGSRLGNSMNLTGEATRLHAQLPKSHGSLQAGLELGRIIRKHNLNTYVDLGFCMRLRLCLHVRRRGEDVRRRDCGPSVLRATRAEYKHLQRGRKRCAGWRSYAGRVFGQEMLGPRGDGHLCPTSSTAWRICQ